MRRSLLAFIVAVIAFAGCTGPDGDRASGDDTPDTSSPALLLPNGTMAPRSYAIEDCSEMVAVLTLPEDTLDGLVPPGFSAEGPAEGLVYAIFVGQDCTWRDGEAVGIAKAYVTVDPPDAWEAPNATSHALYLALVTSSQDLADVLTAWGLGPVVTVGDVALETTVTPGGGSGQLTASGQGQSLTIDTVVRGPAEAGIGAPSRIFVADDRLEVTGAVDIEPREHEGALEGTARITHDGFRPTNPLPTYAGQGLQLWGFGQDERYVELPALEGAR